MVFLLSSLQLCLLAWDQDRASSVTATLGGLLHPEGGGDPQGPPPAFILYATLHFNLLQVRALLGVSVMMGAQ